MRQVHNSQFKANPKPILRLAVLASANMRPSTHALPRAAQDEEDGSWRKEDRLILSHDATHRESKDARHSPRRGP
jgi:predicted secreted protein